MDIPLWLKLLIAAPGLYLLARFLLWVGSGGGRGDPGGGTLGDGCDGDGGGGD